MPFYSKKSSSSSPFSVSIHPCLTCGSREEEEVVGWVGEEESYQPLSLPHSTPFTEWGILLYRPLSSHFLSPFLYLYLSFYIPSSFQHSYPSFSSLLSFFFIFYFLSLLVLLSIHLEKSSFHILSPPPEGPATFKISASLP